MSDSCEQREQVSGALPFLIKRQGTRQIVQEIWVTPEGYLVIPWMRPRATDLILGAWRSVNPNTPFPVQVVEGDIYCG